MVRVVQALLLRLGIHPEQAQQFEQTEEQAHVDGHPACMPSIHVRYEDALKKPLCSDRKERFTVHGMKPKSMWEASWEVQAGGNYGLSSGRERTEDEECCN